MDVDFDRLDELALIQADLVSRQQCLAVGLTDDGIGWQLGTGRWRATTPGVYLTKPGRDDAEVLIWTSLLRCDPRRDPELVRAAVAGVGAAYLWRLTPTVTAPIHVVVPACRRVDRGAARVVRRVKDFDQMVIRTLDPPRTSIAATVLDCAALGSPDDALSWVARSVQSRKVTTSMLAAELERRGRHRHGKLLRECLTSVDLGAESAAEVRYIRDVEEAHGLPSAVRQHRGVAGRHDNHYVGYDLIIEVDGRMGHENWTDRVRDGRRDRMAVVDTGWTSRVFWPDVAITPCITASQVGALLNRAGWLGRVRPCRRQTCALRQAA